MGKFMFGSSKNRQMVFNLRGKVSPNLQDKIEYVEEKVWENKVTQKSNGAILQPPCLELKLHLPRWNANNSSTLKDPKRDALDLGLGLDDVILQGLRKDAESDLLLVGNVRSFCWSDRNMTLPWNMIPNMLKSYLIWRFPAQVLTLDFLYCNVRPPLHSSRVSLRFAAFLPAAPPTTLSFHLLPIFCCFLLFPLFLFDPSHSNFWAPSSCTCCTLRASCSGQVWVKH